MRSAIMDDLERIQEQSALKPLAILNPAVWQNFQQALAKEGCSYWGRLYERIFEHGLDGEDLERRMNVPEEIRERGAAAVAAYLEELEKGAERLNEDRIIILGEKGVGKTSLARRLMNPAAPMPNPDESTAGVETSLWKLKEENINVHIWDFAGHVITHAVHQFFLSARCLYIMVYDGRCEERNRLEYWLNYMKNYGGDSKAFIVVNRRDDHSVDIPLNNLKESYAITGDLHTFSIDTDKEELENFRTEVADYIQNNPSWNRQEIPVGTYQVKEKLESLFAPGDQKKATEHITQEELRAIAKSCGVEDVEELLVRLNDLGIGLSYKEMKKYNTLILNPEWISHGVYQIINWVHEQKGHSLTLSDFASVFSLNADRYPTEKHEFLFDLMKLYELAYETGTGKTLIIPHLLPEDRPATLPEFPVGESLMLKYKAEQPWPSNTISRFIVRHHQEIGDYAVWRYGVALEDGQGSLALVREDAMTRTISVEVKGADKTNYISALRETLDDIFGSYKSKKPDLLYRVERFGLLPPEDIRSREPLMLSEQKIMNHMKLGESYLDDETGQKIPMSGVVNIYNIKAETVVWDNRITVNFYDCKFELQGSLNQLAKLLKKNGHAEESEEIAKAEEELEGCETEAEVKKKGVADRLKTIVFQLEDANSPLNKTLRAIKNGTGIVKALIPKIISAYHTIARCVQP